VSSPVGKEDRAPRPRSDESPERALVEGVRTGDVAAFETLFRAYWDALYRFAFRYLRSTDEAEEVVQSVFARIWQVRAEWRVGGSVPDHLYLATRNACLDRLRHHAVARRWRERRVGELRAGDAEPAVADRMLQTAEIEAAIERSLAELPARRREICELRLSGDLSYAEIAERLGVAPKTVETQIARGLKFLRGRLRELLD
jgi:RNA polymerase sigma-70 factor, ECF subfamily